MKKWLDGNFFNRTATTLVAAAMLIPTVVVAQVPTYQILDLGTLGGNYSSGLDINDAGQVTGDSTTADDVSHAFLYTDGVMVDLGTLAGDAFVGGNSGGVDINNAGQVTGASTAANGETHAYLYSDGVMVDLGTVSGSYSSGSAINGVGQVTGVSATPDNAFDYRAFLYTNTEGMKDLGTLGDSYSTGDDINDSGEVVGIYQDQYESHAYLFSHGTLIDLLPGTASYIATFGQSINAAGHVIGTYQVPNPPRSFLFRDGGAIDIGTLGGEYATALGINDATQITGNSTTTNGEDHAFLYAAGGMEDLGTLGGASSIGLAINSAGHVTGQSITTTGEYHPFVYANGRMTDLGLPAGGINGFGQAINAAGQVTGIYQLESGDEFEPYYLRAFLATPISLLFSRLLDKVDSVGPGEILARTVRWAQRYYEVPDLRSTCAVLTGFVYEVRALSHKKEVRNKAKELIADARSIERALGCRLPRGRGSDRSAEDAAAVSVFAADEIRDSSAKEQAMQSYKDKFKLGLHSLPADGCAKESNQFLRSLVCRTIPPQ